MKEAMIEPEEVIQDEEQEESPVGMPITIKFRIVGRTPILMHNDDVEWAGIVDEERGLARSAREKKGHKVVKGDDRDPAWTWIGYCYNDGGNVAIPVPNMHAAVIYAATKIPKKPRGSYKADAAALVTFGEPYLKLLVRGKTISWKKIEDLQAEPRFDLHKKASADMGFRLDVRRAKIGASKHVRVRPRFESWSAEGTVILSPGAISAERQASDRGDAPSLKEIFAMAGRYSGLCDWRPGSPSKPGPYGTFDVDAWEIIG